MQRVLAVRVGLGTFVLFLGVALVLAAPPDGKGKGGGDEAPAAGALYGDLYVVERDGKGEPITRTVTYEDSETGADVEVECLQPLARPSADCNLGDCELIPLNGEKEDFDPEVEDACGVQADYVDCVQEVSFGRESVSRSPAAVLDKSYAEALKSINSAAAECGDDDANAITKDPAGRLMLCVPDELNGAYAWKTIDAPLENLGLYRAVMADGCFGKVTEEVTGEEGAPTVMTYVLDPSGIFYLRDASLGHLVCAFEYEPGSWLPTLEEENCTVDPDPVGGPADEPCWWEATQTPDRTAAGYEPGDGVTAEDMLSATVFIAAGADKTSPVTLDEIINVNTYVGVNLWTYERVKKETILTVRYFPFAEAAGPGGWFGYQREVDACQPGTLFDLLVADNQSEMAFTIEEVDVFGASPPGVDLRDGNGVGITVCRGGQPLTTNGNGEGRVICDANGANPVYDPDDIFGCGGANWFAQAAEDARKTIWYLHNWEVPEIAY